MKDYVNRLIETGRVRVIDREVSPHFELAAVVEKSQKESPDAILFKNVTGTNLPVIANLYGSNDRLCQLIGARPGEFCKQWNEILNRTPNFDRYVACVETEPSVKAMKISELPHIVWREKDAGPYISAGIFYARDPITGIGNLSFCRTLMNGDDELICCIDPPHDLAKYYKKAEELGRPLDVAILIGAPPDVFLAACASVPTEMDEMQIAASIRGEAIPVRRCRTIDLEVPAETQIVIEGSIRLNQRKPEGPFGEYMGYYGAVNPDGYVIDVKAVDALEGAIFQGLLCGTNEDLGALNVGFATRTYASLSGALPGILDVACNPMFFCSVIKIDQQYEGHAKQVLLSAFAANPSYNFVCIVVDKDIDIHNFREVFWAYLTRGRVDERILCIPGVPGWDRSPDPLYMGRVGIDATMPLGREHEFERARTPGASDINLSDYLS